jgi:hypothetical protein
MPTSDQQHAGAHRQGKARSARHGQLLISASVASPKSCEHRGRRCARRARREEGAYRVYATDEQRRAPGCSAGFGDATLLRLTHG